MLLFCTRPNLHSKDAKDDRNEDKEAKPDVFKLDDALVEWASKEACHSVLRLYFAISSLCVLCSNFCLSSFTAAWEAGSKELFVSEALSKVVVVYDLNCWHNQNDQYEVDWDNNRSEDAKRADWHNF